MLRNGSKEQKDKYLPQIAAGELRIQSMAVTEPTTGTDTTKIKTTAVKKGERYVVNGQKVWISRVQHSDLMILLARTTPLSARCGGPIGPLVRGATRKVRETVSACASRCTHVAGARLTGLRSRGLARPLRPKGTPKPVIDKPAAALQEALKDPTVKTRFAELNAEPVSPDKA